MSTQTIGAVILAAGGSSRLGRPKQLVRYRGETLILRAARSACSAGCAPVVVVVGDAPRPIEKELQPLAVHLCHHTAWQLGIGSSVRTGVARALDLDPSLNALVLMVCDQVFATAEIIRALVAAHERTQKRIIACTYGGTLGVPALFDRSFFPSLLALPDEQGAKHLFSAHADEIARVEFPQGTLDIDTPADLRAITLSGPPEIQRQ